MVAKPDKPDSARRLKSAHAGKSGDAPLRAILVIHGVGQQLPFQPIDSFVGGLRATLEQDERKVSLTHFMHWRDEGYDHSVRVEARDPRTRTLHARLDIHEFYWANLTQGKASFMQMLQWLLITGFTPVQRLAFNLPLLLQRAEARSEQSRMDLQNQRDGSNSEHAGWPGWLRQAGAMVTGTRTFWLMIEFFREMWRLVYVAVAAAVITALAAAVVHQSTVIVRDLPEKMSALLQVPMTWSGAASITAALIALIAAIALLIAIPEQIRQLMRLRRLKPVPGQELVEAAGRGFKQGKNIIGRLVRGVMAGVGALGSSMTAARRWKSELRARSWLLPMSVASFAIATGALYWLSRPEPLCLAGDLICPTPAVHTIVTILEGSGLPLLLLTLAVAYFLTHVFVHYLGDIALYTMAAENSKFYQTRVEIQKALSKQLRVLLRDSQYESVAIAGHSLGSVIGYDAISLLRAEVARDDASGPDPITRAQFAKLTTFITFGSPLNKVLYFFRIRIKDYESIRSHIVRELLGFRQQESLLTRDPSLPSKTAELPDRLRWLNFYSPMDPISGRLIYFSKVREHRYWYAIWGYCHMSYWFDPKMYHEILATLQPEKAETAAEAMAAEAV